MRALGIDFGTVRVGVAVSDDKMHLASALTTIEYPKNNYQYVIDQLRLIIKRYEVELIVFPDSCNASEGNVSVSITISNFLFSNIE